MKRAKWTCRMGALGVIIVFATAPAQAEMVSHHEFMVDANARAEGCLSCHDGKVAKNISFCRSTCDYASSHALLKEYPPAGKADRYAPAAALEAKGIKLEDGKVTCISCHDLRKTSRGHLIMSNAGSRLCFACHVIL